MARGSKSQRHEKPSIKYRCGPLDGASFEQADFDFKEYVSTPENNEKESKIPEVRPSEILSTRELISAIGSIWDHTSRPLSVLLPKSSCRDDNDYVRKQNVLGYSTEKWRCSKCADDKQNHLVNLTSNSDLLPLGHANLKYLKVADKISFTEPCTGSYSLLRRFILGNPKMLYGCRKETDVSNGGLLFDLEKVYGWMSKIPFADFEYQVNFTAIEKHKNSGHHGGNISDPASCHVSIDKPSDADNLVAGNTGYNTDNTKLAVSASGQYQSNATNMSVSATSFLCEHAAVKDIEACTSQVPSSKLCTDSHISISPSCSSDIEGSNTSVNPDIEETNNEQKEFVVEDKYEVGTFSPMKEKPHYMLAKQEHAFAGAMAGIFVSMCLHPVDTIKTVVQSCHTGPKSLLDVTQSIISERGAV